jgi:hypothetical protein
MDKHQITLDELRRLLALLVDDHGPGHHGSRVAGDVQAVAQEAAKRLGTGPLRHPTFIDNLLYPTYPNGYVAGSHRVILR